MAAYAPKDIRRARRDDLGPFGQCVDYPCDDWMRWAAPGGVLSRYGEPRAGLPGKLDDKHRELSAEPVTSPLLDAPHPGMPVLIWTANGRVHGRESAQYRGDVRKLAYFNELAPIGSENEAAFLEAAEALFAGELAPQPGH